MSSSVSEWENQTIIARVNRLRGMELARTGSDVSWADIGRSLGWSQTTTSTVSTGNRDLRVAEIALIAQFFGASPGWIAFGEGVPKPGQRDPIAGVPFDEGEDVTPEALEGEEVGQPPHKRRRRA